MLFASVINKYGHRSRSKSVHNCTTAYIRTVREVRHQAQLPEL